MVLMNELAEEIGMEHSHFANPEGWDDEEHYSTVSDMLLLAKYVLGIPEITQRTKICFANVDFISGETYTWVNTNHLIDPGSVYYCEDCTGLKTGTTASAGACLLATFEIDGKTYISVVTGCDEEDDRFILTLALLNDYVYKTAEPKAA